MSILLPFDPLTFQSDMKKKISGVDLVLEYENIESSLSKISIDCSEILTREIYEGICKKQLGDESFQETSHDYLQRVMLHFCIYEHLIFLIARIKNDGVTVQKSDSETTIYKYMQDGLENKLISLGWFWMNQLIKLLNESNIDEWNKDNKLNLLPVLSSDFKMWVGVADEYFMVAVGWLIREVWSDCVLSRIKDPQKNDKIARAVCYEVMGRACKVLAYKLLPEPIRLDISNEMSKSSQDRAETLIREKIASRFLEKAESYWTSFDIQLRNEEVKNERYTRPLSTSPEISEEDPFCF